MANNIGLKPQTLRPTAAPRDTFVMPNAGAGLGQLADSLSQLAPSLARYGSVVAQEQGDKEKLRGENEARAFVEAHGVYKDAIDKGLIQKNQSPFYRIGAYETFGRASAQRFKEDFDVALGASDVSQSTKPEDFDSFEGKFRQQWMKEHFGDNLDPHMEGAFGRTADNLVEGARAEFSQGAGQRLEGQLNDSFQAEVHSIVKDGYTAHESDESVLAKIQLAMQRQLNGHMAPTQVNDNVAASIVSAAKRLNDMTVLDLMDKIKVGSGYMGGVSRFAKLREDAENEIASVNQNRLTVEEAQKERKKRDAVDAVTGDLVTALQQDPTVDVKPYIARAVAAGDPDKATVYVGIQKALVDHTYMDVPEVKQRLLIGVHTGYTSMARLDKALGAKAITFQTYAQLADDVKQRDKQGLEQGTAANSKLVAQMERIRTRAKALFVADQGDFKPDQARLAENAASEAIVNWLEWRKTPEGQKADDVKTEQWLHTELARQQDTKLGDGSPADQPEAVYMKDTKPVDPAKNQAISPETYDVLEKELQTGMYSDGSLRIIRRYKLFKPGDLAKFLQQQKQFMPDSN